MEDVHAAALTSAGATRPALLISLHDVSPLTLGACQRAWAMLIEAGVRASQLTAFVIPFHESKVRVDEHPDTARWLSTLAAQGADLVMHGLTHRMTGRSWTPAGFARAHVFARGQGEFFRCDGAETSRRLEEGTAILRRAGLDAATRAFIPPAWLLSPAAVAVVEAVGFDFVERFDGIAVSGQGDRRLARRVIGWGSLSELEARATAIYAGWQARRPVVDTRLAVHPVDVDRPSQRRAVTRALARLLPRMRPQRYSDFLTAA